MSKKNDFPGACAPVMLPLAAMLMAVSFGANAETGNDTNKNTVVLEPVVVKDQAEQGYLATKTRVGKVQQDPHDIPQAVTTLTSKMLDEQQVGSLREALRNVSGLSFNAAEGGRSGDNFNLRGFYTFGDLYLDGMRDTAQYNREIFNFEQIDVLRGAGAMLFGRGQAGGVINMVSKTPLKFDQYKMTASVGSYGYNEVTADLNKSFSDATQLRVNLMNRDEGSWRSNPSDGAEPEISRKGAAFSLALNQDTNNRFWINHYFVKTQDNPDYGIPFDATRRITKNFPADTYWGTDHTFDYSETNITTFVNEYQFAKPDTSLRTQLRIGDYRRSYWARTGNTTTPPNSTGLNGTNTGNLRSSFYETVTLQSDYSTKFELAGMQHQFLTGVEYLNENSHRVNSLANMGGTTTSNPPAFYPYLEANGAARTDFKSDSYAVYVQDTVEFVPNWKATLGLRYDLMDATYSSASSPKLRYGETSVRSGLSYQPQPDTHYYVGYSDSFSPTADLYQLTTVAQPAERSQVLEVGSKFLFMEGDLAFRTAVYRADKEWERSGDLESTATILTKKRRTDGLEFELAGRMTDKWEVFSGIALMDARIRDTAENVNATTGAVTKGDERFVGQRARNTPAYTFNLWTTYKLPGNWKVGGGVESKGKRYGYVPSSANQGALFNSAGAFAPNTIAGYNRLDAMVAYEQLKWALRLNVKNVLNTVYYDQLYDNGSFAVPGTKRQAILTAEVKF